MEVGERVCEFIPGSVVENVLCLCRRRRRLALRKQAGNGQGDGERQATRVGTGRTMAGMWKGREPSTLACVHTKRRANETPSYYYYYFIQSGYPHVGVRQGQIDVERE